MPYLCPLFFARLNCAKDDKKVWADPISMTHFDVKIISPTKYFNIAN
jgi:hypothetical protein